MSQLGPIQNHSNHATRVACDIDKTAQRQVSFFLRVLYCGDGIFLLWRQLKN
jgi:hypothetical protein